MPVWVGTKSPPVFGALLARSGIDFALSVAAELAGVDTAKGRQLTLQYAPEPPFDAGGPDRPDADPEVVAGTIAAMSDRWGLAVTKADARLGLA